jgi:hypothetical protein
MIRFAELERFGLAIAAMSDRSDGDCGRHHAEGESGREAICTALSIRTEDIVLARQVHGDVVARATNADRGRGTVPNVSAFPDTDAIVTNVPGLPLGVTIADCVPVWLFDPVTRSAGVVHAGRVGTFKNIAGAAVVALRDAYGANPKNLHAVVGPSAGPDAYEVSEDIAVEFAVAGHSVRGRFLDLWESNAQQLERAGIPRENISVAGICTITDGRFHSHRAHANGMRNLAIVML